MLQITSRLKQLWEYHGKSKSEANLSLLSLLHALAIGPLSNLILLPFQGQERDLLKDQLTAG